MFIILYFILHELTSSAQLCQQKKIRYAYIFKNNVDKNDDMNKLV